MQSKLDIMHIAKLSKLRINKQEAEQFGREMDAIVAMIERMPQIDEEVLLNPRDSMVLREDEVSDERLSRDELLKNAPSVQAGCIVVPKTVES